MKNNQIVLDFGSVTIDAELFDSSIAAGFAENLPCTVELEQWGDELYGPVRMNLGEENPVQDVPAGGIAYTSIGNYLCVFFGQKPAWPVEYIGQIDGDKWKALVGNVSCDSVSIRTQDIKKNSVPK